MDFRTAYSTVPLGTVLSFSDGTPQPPKHHKKKLSAWEQRNGKGRLIGRQESNGKPYSRDTLTLETHVYGSGETIIMRVRRIFQEEANTALTLSTFEIVETLPAGSFVIISDSIHVGRELHAVRATREAIEAEKQRGFRPDNYVIASVGENGEIMG